jgi:hypothetical protein
MSGTVGSAIAGTEDVIPKKPQKNTPGLSVTAGADYEWKKKRRFKMIRKIKWLLLTVFVVSWQTSTNWVVVPCTPPQPDGITCVKGVPVRNEHVFKTEDAAEGFQAAMQEMKAPDLKMEKRDK